MKNKVKNFIPVWVIFLSLALISFCASFFFAVSDFCDSLENLHPDIVILLRLATILFVIVCIVSFLFVIFYKREIKTKAVTLIMIIATILGITSSLIFVKVNYKDIQQYNESGVVKKQQEQFFPFGYEDAVCSFSKYDFLKTHYVSSYTTSGLFDTDTSFQSEYFYTESPLLMKQFLIQSSNSYDIIDIEKISQKIQSTEDGISYRLVKANSGIKIVIQNKNEVFFCSLFGEGYNENNYPTKDYIEKTIKLYKAEKSC